MILALVDTMIEAFVDIWIIFKLVIIQKSKTKMSKLF